MSRRGALQSELKCFPHIQAAAACIVILDLSGYEAVELILLYSVQICIISTIGQWGTDFGHSANQFSDTLYFWHITPDEHIAPAVSHYVKGYSYSAADGDN